jgi:DNA invertase Pin-like site-specific DNA recombinase
MKYFIYARKSTESEDRQKLSISAQLAELKEFAAKEKLEIVASFQEAKTAKEPEKILARTLFWPKAGFFLIKDCKELRYMLV